MRRKVTPPTSHSRQSSLPTFILTSTGIPTIAIFSIFSIFLFLADSAHHLVFPILLILASVRHLTPPDRIFAPPGLAWTQNYWRPNVIAGIFIGPFVFMFIFRFVFDWFVSLTCFLFPAFSSFSPPSTFYLFRSVGCGMGLAFMVEMEGFRCQKEFKELLSEEGFFEPVDTSKSGRIRAHVRDVSNTREQPENR